ncbi:MAG: SMP-30/gluconolactonase/LRE family protein [archaeon]|nr:SMP-30/gluconolactonase/LRE family protein [archaeon]
MMAGVRWSEATELPLLNVSGFTWAENLAFDLSPGRSQLYVSDAGTGFLWRIFLNGGGSGYEAEVLAKFGQVNGLQMAANNTVLYACVKIGSSAGLAKGQTAVVAVDVSQPAGSGAQSWRVVADLPAMGNGLALHEATQMLYTTYEADEIPGAGSVYAVDTLGLLPVQLVATGLQGTDGCRIDPSSDTLYVSDVVAARLDLFKLPTSRQGNMTLSLLRSFKAPSMKFLDDFALDWQQNLIFGADFATGRVVKFNADGSSSSGEVVASGLLNPTSVQIGAGSSFNHTSIYVTEGGGIRGINTDRRVLEFRGLVTPFLMEKKN